MAKIKSFVKKTISPVNRGAGTRIGFEEVNNQFCINEAYTANALQFVTVKRNGDIVEASAEDVANPKYRPYVLIHMVNGRSRRHRYIVSNGKRYYNVLGQNVKKHSCWGPQQHPFTVSNLLFGDLNQFAKLVVNASIDHFLKSVKLKSELDFDG